MEDGAASPLAPTEVHSSSSSSESTSPPPSFHGLIKRHPTDFVVREVDLGGRVAKLTVPPALPVSWASLLLAADDLAAPAASAAAVLPACACLGKEELQAAVGADTYQALEALHQRHVMDVLLSKETETPVGGKEEVGMRLPADRAARGILHGSLKAAFPGTKTRSDAATATLVVVPDAALVETATQLLAQEGVALPQVLSLLALLGRGRGEDGVLLGPLADKAARAAVHRIVANGLMAFQSVTRDDGCVEVVWKASKKRLRDEGALFLRLVLRKENVEHLEALGRVAHALGVSLTAALGCAGVKDKRAVTYQYLTVKVERSRAALEAVRRGLAQLAVEGRGVQVGNVEDWCAHRRLLQTGESNGNAFSLVVRDILPLETGSSSGAEPVQADLEARLCHLRDQGTVNVFGAQRVGSNETHRGTAGQPFELGRALLQQDWEAFTKLLLGVRSGKHEDSIQAAKALFWDGSTPLSTVLKKFPPSMAREKLFVQALQKHGRDHVGMAARALPYGVRTQWVNAYQAMLWNRVAAWRVQRYGLQAVVGDLVLVPNGEKEERPTVRPLTAEDFAKDGAAETLRYDMVLPLMGHDVVLPENEVKETYRQLLEEEGVWTLITTRQDKDSRAVVGNLKGAYRPLLVKPEGLAWSFSPRPPPSGAGKGTDVELSFSLRPGSYATVLVRDLLGHEPVSMTTSSNVWCFYYVQGEEGESAEEPNAFPIPSSSSSPTLRHFQASFPLGKQGLYHARFKVKDEQCGYGWQDLVDPQAALPVFQGAVHAKVLRLDKPPQPTSRLRRKPLGRASSSSSSSSHTTSTTTAAARGASYVAPPPQQPPPAPSPRHASPSPRAMPPQATAPVRSSPPPPSPQPTRANTGGGSGANFLDTNGPASTAAPAPKASAGGGDDLDSFLYGGSGGGGGGGGVPPPKQAAQPRPQAATSVRPPSPANRPSSFTPPPPARPNSSSPVPPSMAGLDIDDDPPATSMPAKAATHPSAAVGATPEELFFMQPTTAKQAEAANQEQETDAVRIKVGPKLEQWAKDPQSKKLRNVRALLSTMHAVMWEGCTWKAVSLGDLMMPDRVKFHYRKAMLVLHPDKNVTGSLEQRFIAEKVFTCVNEAYTVFAAQELK